MAYKVKLSKKNQGTIPVDVLEDLGFVKNTANNFIILVKDIRGGYRLVNQLQEIQNMAGSINSIEKISSDQDLENAIVQAKLVQFNSKKLYD